VTAVYIIQMIVGHTCTLIDTKHGPRGTRQKKLQKMDSGNPKHRNKNNTISNRIDMSVLIIDC
jgi:hypothetical protein